MRGDTSTVDKHLARRAGPSPGFNRSGSGRPPGPGRGYAVDSLRLLPEVLPSAPGWLHVGHQESTCRLEARLGKTYEAITPELAAWIQQQHVFFVATAPLSGDGHVNTSPKGLDWTTKGIGTYWLAGLPPREPQFCRPIGGRRTPRASMGSQHSMSAMPGMSLKRRRHGMPTRTSWLPFRLRRSNPRPRGSLT